MAVFSHHRIIIGLKGGLVVLLSVILSHIESPRVIDSAIGALMNMAIEDVIKRQIAGANGIQLVLGIMQKFKDDSNIQRNATGFLRNVTHKSLECQKQFTSSNGFNVILQSLNLAKNDKVVTENGLAILLNSIHEGGNDEVMKVLSKVIEDSTLCNPKTNISMAKSQFEDINPDSKKEGSEIIKDSSYIQAADILKPQLEDGRSGCKQELCKATQDLVLCPSESRTTMVMSQLEKKNSNLQQQRNESLEDCTLYKAESDIMKVKSCVRDESSIRKQSHKKMFRGISFFNKRKNFKIATSSQGTNQKKLTANE
eukprot:CAMPEP_0113316408 /NCGR_PEP_ID=MMETSP0010_2-20120614/11696_1 /TAXON_ID=216773 ORGANISM="Corethron hystrix, Strain 308" /NCGR_SAMPLE_ID=MMETSP0010_2 /ASSEMBLY_ACC=CAM_ASM_000155 /LENGTH=311 /DNA_ID=CAMNT_0000173119 /DNA_START=93 /DNA_END=1028 /DNA_ORIENTATION=- /assembly_acc=CAM_ASM_000155